MLSTTKM